MPKSTLKQIAILFLSSFLASAPALAATVILQPGPGANDGSDDGSAGKGKDCYVHQLKPNEIFVNEYLYAGFEKGSGGNSCSFIQFDIDDQPVDVDLVLLNIRRNKIDDSLAGAAIYAYKVTQAWTEGNVTWNNMPASEDVSIEPSFLQMDSRWISFDITNLYKSWKGEQKNFGVALQVYTGADQAKCVSSDCLSARLNSSDIDAADHRPLLLISHRENQAGEYSTEDLGGTWVFPDSDGITGLEINTSGEVANLTIKGTTLRRLWPSKLYLDDDGKLFGYIKWGSNDRKIIKAAIIGKILISGSMEIEIDGVLYDLATKSYQNYNNKIRGKIQ